MSLQWSMPPWTADSASPATIKGVNTVKYNEVMSEDTD